MRLPGVPDNIEKIEGPNTLGQCFAWGLDGMLYMQVLFYYLAFPNDRRPIKLLVWSVLLADIVMTIFGTIFAYKSLASGWGDLDALYKIPWTLPPMPAICGFIASAVQIFYCWRIWVLSRNKYIPIFLILTSVAQFAAGTYTGIHLGSIGDWRSLDENGTVATIWLGASAFCDFSITSCMVFLLFRRREDANRYTESIINKIITYTIETGLVPAIGAMCQISFFFASTTRTTNIHLIFFFMLAKLYSNSMMANLNARKVMSMYVSSSGVVDSGSAFWKGSIPHSSIRAAVKQQQTDSSLGSSSGANEDLEMNVIGRRHDDATFQFGKK